MRPFAYSKLSNPGSEIRILTLAKGGWDDSLQGILSVAELANCPPFEALSYHWGSPLEPCTLQIQTDCSLSGVAISKNLHQALRRLRLRSRERRIWADAICIDQGDDTEKSQQITQMAEIYSSAQAVQIYLGEQDDDSKEAFDLMDRIVQAVESTPAEDARADLQWIRDSRLPLPTEPWAWQALKDFYRRPWFRRKWIIQETIVSAKAIVSCGDWQKDWSWFELVESATSKYGLAVNDYTTYENPEASMQLQQGLAQMKEMIRVKTFWKSNIRFDLIDLLYRFQTARASDRRDHLFALLGLAAKDSGPELKADYQSSVADVVERYASFYLQQKRNLQVLYLAGLHGHQLLAPSWIPNWYGTQEGFAFEYAQGPWSYMRRQSLPDFYNAAPEAKLEILPSSPRVLGLRGCRIDSIVKMANSYRNESSQSLLSKDALLQRICRHAQESDTIMDSLSSYPTGEELAEVHWRTLVCNVTHDLSKPPPDFSVSYHAWRRTQQWPPLKLGSTEWQLQKPFAQAIGSYNNDKIFGVTENGYVGMFPWTAEARDEIYLLFGGDFPFVLRRLERQGDFQLVGQCYVHGIMEGQIDCTSRPSEAVYLGGPYDSMESAAT